jgi:formate dehydrogenase maturation protein FdhE
MIAELLKLLNELLPMIHPDEAAKVQAKIEKMEKERDEKRNKALAAIRIGDVPTLNRLLAELLDEL